jgi:hypothetical protein
MIAMAVFFIVVFAILNVVVQSLGAARALQKRHADAGMLAAQLSIAALTNGIQEGYDSGDFGDIVPDTRWESETREVSSNGLYQVDFAVFENVGKGHEVAERMMILIHCPGCAAAARGKGLMK